ncbi:MAG: hypothetical protein IJ265_11875 [Oscillospiraceae bacterium]|nr:hypothetical protein [Oscillospiraceae bacterium]
MTTQLQFTEAMMNKGVLWRYLMKKCCMNVFEDSGVLVRIVAIIVTALLALTMSSCETIEESSMSSTDTTDEKDKGDENEGIVIGGDIGNHNTIVFDMGNEKFPDKQVAAIITQAEELAAAGDYDGAISQIQTGLETYSDFESLQKKLEEYEAKRNALIKEETINTTESNVLMAITNPFGYRFSFFLE